MSSITTRSIVNASKEKIEVKLRTMLESYDSLVSLSRMELPVLLSYKISKALSKVEERTKEFVKTRKEILDKYGKEKDGKYEYEEENEKKAEEEMKHLIGVSVSLDLSKISISEFGSVALAPSILVALDWLLKD